MQFSGGHDTAARRQYHRLELEAGGTAWVMMRTEAETNRHGKQTWRMAAALFPVVLLLFATYFLFGQIGFWSDDYWHNQRNPVTGELPDRISGLVIDRGFFLRPLFYIIVPGVTTLLWKADWLAHLIMVGAHGLVVVLLWRLMLRLGIGQRAAGAAALLFMVYPIQFEVVLWISALPTTLAAALMLVSFHLHLGLVGVSMWSGRFVMMLGAIPLLAFAVCTLNEQSVMGVLAMPLLYGAAVIGRGGLVEAESSSVRRIMGDHAWRCFGPPLLSGLAVMLYLYMVKRGFPPYVLPIPPGTRGAADTLVTLDQLPQRVPEFARGLWPRIWMKNFAAGAVRQGLQELRTAGPATVIWLLLLATTAVGWAVNWVSPAAVVSPQKPRGNRWRGSIATMGFGAAVYITGFVPPMLVAVYRADSRLMYWPSIGGAIALGSLASLLAMGAAPLLRGKAALAARTGAAVGLLAVLMVWSVAYIGIQSAFRERWRKDQDEGRQLRALLPAPDPLTFFVPLRIQRANLHTGSPVFDRHHRSVWEFPWTAPKYIKRVYGSDEVRAGYKRWWQSNFPVRGGSEAGLHYGEQLGPRFPKLESGDWLISWERAAPFVVEDDGRVQLVTSVILEGGGSTSTEVLVPQAQEALRSGKQEAVEVRLPRR